MMLRQPGKLIKHSMISPLSEMDVLLKFNLDNMKQFSIIFDIRKAFVILRAEKESKYMHI